MDGPSVGHFAQDRLEEHRFPGAVGPDERGEFTAMKVQRDVFQNRLTVQRDIQLLDPGTALAAAVGSQADVVVVKVFHADGARLV
jgi:hypothetical protein